MDCGDGDPWAAAAGEGEWNVRLGMNPNPPPLIPAWRPTATPPSPRARLGLAQSPFPALALSRGGQRGGPAGKPALPPARGRNNLSIFTFQQGFKFKYSYFEQFKFRK